MPPARGGHIALLFCIYLSAAIREGQVIIALERLYFYSVLKSITECFTPVRDRGIERGW